MKKAFSLLAVASMITISAIADNYKIVFINTPSIEIGGKQLKVGDVFSDADAVSWTTDKQAMKVQNVNTKTLKVYASQQFSKVGAKSLFDFMEKSGHLSTRGDGLMDLDGLTEYLSDTFYLVDAERVESMIETTKEVYFQAVFSVNDKQFKEKLAGGEDYFILDPSVFVKAGAGSAELPVIINYIDNKAGETEQITDKMKIVIVEQ